MLDLFGFNSIRLKQLGLNFNHAIVLHWLIVFSSSGNQEVLVDEHDIKYFWIKYSKLSNDILLPFDTNYKINKCLDELCGINTKNGKAYPLHKKVFSTNYGKKVGFAINENAIAWLKDSQEDNMSGFNEELGIENKVSKINKKRKVKLNPYVKQILLKLADIKKEDHTPLFSFILPDDDYHYSRLVETFQTQLLTMYAGKFILSYKNNIATWFLKKYAYYDTDKNKKIMNGCKGNWQAIEDALMNAADNFVKWHVAGNELHDKDKLPKNPATFIFNTFNQLSMFWVCLVSPPTSYRESSAEIMYKSIEPRYRAIAKRLYNDKFDGYMFWSKIKGLVNWHNKNADNLISGDSNYLYWLGNGCDGFLTGYCDWILEFTEQQPFLKNIGVGNPTWDLYCKTKKKEHGIAFMAAK